MDNIHLRELLIKRHYNLEKLTEQEENELNAYLSHSIEAKQIEAEILSIPKEEVEKFMTNVNLDTMYENILDNNNKNEKIWSGRNFKLIAAASVFATLLTIGWLLSRDKEVHYHTEISNLNKGATLQLSNGKTIYLNDSGRQNIQLGNTVVSNTNRVIQLPTDLKSTENENSGWNTITVPNRLDYEIQLPDGSIVWLNSATKFRFPLRFGKAIREVYLDGGEAYFKVAGHSAKPFMVHTQQTLVNVLGTEFNVNAYNKESILTSLVSGKVQLTGINHTNKILQPGEQGLVSENEMEIKSFDLETTISWRQGIHYFHNTPISEVKIMLDRWFNTNLKIDDSKTADIQIRGKLFRHQPIQFFVDQINVAGRVTFYWKNGELHVK